VVKVAPVCEETLFRGFLYAWLRARMTWSVALVIDGLLFGAAHRSLLLLFPLAVGGMILAAVYQYSLSIWPGVVVHGFINLAATVVLITASGC
jgi:membrane protease YdiL (CAAX protease family)